MTDRENPALWAAPAMSGDAARKKCAIRSPWPPFRKFPVLKAELINLPHYIFRVTVVSKKDVTVVEAAVDAVIGHFAYWRPEKLALSDRPGPGWSPGFKLSVEEAEKRLREDYRWALISAGLRRGRSFTAREIGLKSRVYYPFWAGYLQKAEKLDLEILDAISGARQGGKVRDALLAAIIAAERGGRGFDSGPSPA